MQHCSFAACFNLMFISLLGDFCETLYTMYQKPKGSAPPPPRFRNEKNATFSLGQIFSLNVYHIPPPQLKFSFFSQHLRFAIQGFTTPLIFFLNCRFQPALEIYRPLSRVNSCQFHKHSNVQFIPTCDLHVYDSVCTSWSRRETTVKHPVLTA